MRVPQGCTGRRCNAINCSYDTIILSSPFKCWTAVGAHEAQVDGCGMMSAAIEIGNSSPFAGGGSVMHS